MKPDREKLYPWMAVLRAKYMGSERARKLEKHFGSLPKALRASLDEIVAIPGFNEEMARAVREAAQGIFDRDIDKELAWMEKEGISIILFSDPEYPPPLRHIPSPPALLYVKGKILPQDILSLAIVGSRRASDVGRRTAGAIACELAEAGLTIVSGLAWGVDASAHKGALRARQGRTLAVMGSGMKFIYPREHESLADQIVRRGALITELFHDVSPQGRNFPPRNRIISGLSLGVLIVEAPERSGALISANYALEQGKEVFAIPDAINQETSLGTNKLIQDSAAKLVTSAQDILSELEDKITFYRNELEGKIPRVDISFDPKNQTEDKDVPSAEDKQKPAKTARPVPASRTTPNLPPLSEDEQRIYTVLTPEAKHIDVVCRELEWPVARVSSALGLLEFKELVEREAGMRFRRKEGSA